MMPNTNWGLHRRYYGEHHTDRDAAVAEARADFMLDAQSGVDDCHCAWRADWYAGQSV